MRSLQRSLLLFVKHLVSLICNKTERAWILNTVLKWMYLYYDMMGNLYEIKCINQQPKLFTDKSIRKVYSGLFAMVVIHVDRTIQGNEWRNETE